MNDNNNYTVDLDSSYLALNDVMQFDHVVQVHDDGVTVSSRYDVWAPDLMEEMDDDGNAVGHELHSRDEWELLDGYSGQYGYSGPLMHQSEFVGGRMARDVLDNPGVYVALVAYPDDDSDPTEWAVAKLAS